MMGVSKKGINETIYTISPRLYFQLKYFYTRHKFIRFRNPRNLSEYLLSAMTQKEFESYSQYADKVTVREYVKSKGLNDTLPELYGVWDNAESIDFDALPSAFALKTNHGCGNHVICHDKASLDIEAARATIKKGLSTVYNIYEPHYKLIKPMAFAEELISDGMGSLPVDYKFMCVNGKPKCILACSERGEKNVPTKATYDINWNKLPWTQKCIEDNMPKPQHLSEMIEIAERLSQDFNFVRVDLYDCPNKVYFSELTFSPAEGILSTFTTQALELMNPLASNK